MTFLQIVMLYLLIGALAGFCFEILMDRMKMNENLTIGERIGWILLWPIFVLIFVWGMHKDDE